MSNFTTRDVHERACRGRDSWWTVWLVDPLAVPLVRVTANRTSVTPNQLTVAALLLGLGAAACFAWASWPFLLAGALLYALCFLVDCMDGKLARLTDQETLFGGWMDYVFDRFRVLVCAIALMGGQYAETGNVVFVWLALAVVFCDMLRYLNALQVYKVRREMRSYLAAALERARATLTMLEPGRGGKEQRFSQSAQEDTQSTEQPTMSDSGEQAVLRHGISVLEGLLRAQNEREAEVGREAGKEPDLRLPKVDLHLQFRSRFPWYQRYWDFLRARRVRTHLVSGIEFQMAVFVVAPLVGMFSSPAIIWVTVPVGVALLAFEIAIVYKLWLSTQDFFRVVDGIEGALTFGRAPQAGLRLAEGSS
ncbi:CDP-alcohol phosphatidyltransferase family protein [Lipingzhangella sp. LS1_29]|uniref:CDP-alcohol phosphatidyltransferase family protein n=1 Tax=Lipingzhangella rawalii TaxID=2055835 RepID=A0ABU2HAU7_9ACTN|nr:CDP-alcohol phosphatidyltransferase family protein [Lipingzhangella rawalii]MDS1271965.1 CDP-alcohol phosphatidyltransferase family protein [Lipingzhangella rawalii]